jgi:hypothetical protein
VVLDGSGQLLLLRTTEIVQCSSPLDRVLDCPELDPGFGRDVLRCPARVVDSSSPGLCLEPAGPMFVGRLGSLTGFIASRS